MGKEYWNALLRQVQLRRNDPVENVGAPTFKVTLEGNYLLNTRTAWYLQQLTNDAFSGKLSKRSKKYSNPFSRFGSETQLGEVRIARGDVRDGVLGLIVFNEEMLHPSVLR